MDDRRFEVLLSAAEGETASETAERIGCSVAWVGRLRAEACQELGAHNITQAVALAYQRGILSGAACDRCAFRAHR